MASAVLPVSRNISLEKNSTRVEISISNASVWGKFDSGRLRENEIVGLTVQSGGSDDQPEFFGPIFDGVLYAIYREMRISDR